MGFKRFAIKTADKFTGDERFRTEISLYSSIVMNFLMALYQLATGIAYTSAWAYSLSGYYMLLVLIRLLVLNCEVNTKEARDLIVEFRRYRLCGILLLPMELFLGVIAFFIAFDDMGFAYGMMYTIGMTCITTIIMIVAVVNVIRYRKYNSPVLSAAKVINLISGLVSVLSLETALFAAFGDLTDELARKLTTLITGLLVVIITIVMACYMIIRANQGIKFMENIEKLRS